MLVFKKYLSILFAGGFLILIGIVSTQAFAAQVYKVKGKKAIVRLQGLDVQLGDIVLLHSNGTQKARAKIIRLKPTSALVQILKGQTTAGDSMMLADESGDRALATDFYEDDDVNNDNAMSSSLDEDNNIMSLREENDGVSSDVEDNSYDGVNGIDDTGLDAGISSSNEMSSSSRQRPSSPHTRSFSVGGFLGANFNMLQVAFPHPIENFPNAQEERIIPKGFGLDLKAAAGYDISDALGIRAFIGWQQFRATSEASKDSQYSSCRDDDLGIQVACTLKMQIFSLQTLLQYSFFSQGTDIVMPWFGLGAGLIVPFGISENSVLVEDSLKTTGILTAAVGGNFLLSSRLHIVPQFDFNYLLSSASGIRAYFIGFKVGAMFFL